MTARYGSQKVCVKAFRSFVEHGIKLTLCGNLQGCIDMSLNPFFAKTI